MKNVTLYVRTQEHGWVKYKDQPFLFSAREPHINLSVLKHPRDFLVEVKGGCLSDLLTASVVSDALRAGGCGSVSLFVPYMPAGRMDRRMKGQPFTLSVVRSAIESASFDNVYTVDPHSSASDFATCIDFMPEIPYTEDCTIIAPDAGAIPRASQVAAFYRLPIVCAKKTRDPNDNFRVTGYECPSVSTKHAVVIDDICDGGGTFMALAEAISHRSLHLFVTHGIFSRGLEHLRTHYQTIRTTDSINSNAAADHITPLLPLLESRKS